VAVTIEPVDTCSPDVVAAFCRDEARLSSRPSRLKPETLAGMAASPAYHLLVARRDGDICATLTLAVYRAPGGIKARIDDVVAEQTDEGQAAAAALLQEAMLRAAAAGAPVIQLVSKPALSTANSTYERLGFTSEGAGLYHRALRASDGLTPGAAATDQHRDRSPSSRCAHVMDSGSGHRTA
jgi:hypothetical protein